MRYLMALICPPLALLTCHRTTQAAVASVLYVFAIATARWGIGVFVEFFLVLWATNIVGDETGRPRGPGVRQDGQADPRHP